MKIVAVQNVKNKTTISNVRQNQKDLTSFGVSNPQQQEIISKEASDAAKTNFISDISFGGESKEISKNYYCTSGGYYVDQGQAYSPAEAVKISRGWHSNSTLEHTNGNSSRVYYADPEEIITPQIRKDHAYIVYDNKISFPKLEALKDYYFSDNEKEGIYSNGRAKLGEWVEIFNYYERVKKTDLNKLDKLFLEKQKKEEELKKAEEYKRKYDEIYVSNPWGDVPEDKKKADYYEHANREALYFINEKINYYKNKIEKSKNQQRVAAELFSIWEKATKLFHSRDDIARSRVGILYDLNGDFSKHSEKLKTEKNILEAKKQEYEVVENWKKLRESQIKEENEKPFTSSSTKMENNDELKALVKKITNINDEIRWKTNFVKKLEQIPDKIKENDAEMKKVLAELAKLYPELEKFYETNKEQLSL